MGYMGYTPVAKCCITGDDELSGWYLCPYHGWKRADTGDELDELY